MFLTWAAGSAVVLCSWVFSPALSLVSITFQPSPLHEFPALLAPFLPLQFQMIRGSIRSSLDFLSHRMGEI